MIDTPKLVTTVALQAAVIHLTIPRAEIQKVMAPAMKEVMQTLAAQGIAPAGPMFSHHFRMEPGTFDFEVGVPVTKAVAPAGRVKPGNLPAVKVARTVFHGRYEELGHAWGEFEQWIAAQKLKPAPDLWESYVAGPESGPDASKWRTELTRPLAG